VGIVLDDEHAKTVPGQPCGARWSWVFGSVHETFQLTTILEATDAHPDPTPHIACGGPQPGQPCLRFLSDSAALEKKEKVGEPPHLESLSRSKEQSASGQVLGSDDHTRGVGVVHPRHEGHPLWRTRLPRSPVWTSLAIGRIRSENRRRRKHYGDLGFSLTTSHVGPT
jgi:hypothetical protein